MTVNLLAKHGALFDTGGKQVSKWFKWPTEGAVEVPVPAQTTVVSLGFWIKETQSITYVKLDQPVSFEAAGYLAFGDFSFKDRPVNNAEEFKVEYADDDDYCTCTCGDTHPKY